MAAVNPRSTSEVDEEIGARLRARRLELGLPLTHVAELVGITYQQIQKYEAGQNRVSAALLTRLADVLEIEPVDLLPGGARKRARKSESAGEDGMALQLQQAFSRIKSKRQRRFILDLARRVAEDEAPAPRKRARR